MGYEQIWKILGADNFMAKKKYAIDYSEFITVNGDRQNIRVRSQSADLPVLLFLHGGPGVCDRN